MDWGGLKLENAKAPEVYLQVVKLLGPEGGGEGPSDPCTAASTAAHRTSVAPMVPSSIVRFLRRHTSSLGTQTQPLSPRYGLLGWAGPKVSTASTLVGVA